MSAPGPLVICRPEAFPSHREEQGLRLMSDLHLGAACCDEARIRAELAEARSHCDRVLVNGDVFDLILTRDAKRYSPAALHPRLQGRDDLVNAAIDMAYELLAPVADLIDMVGVGNHDAAGERYHNIDPVSLLVQRLNDSTAARAAGHEVSHGGYAGALRYGFAGRCAWNVFYWHGSGRGAFGGALDEFVRKGRPVEGADVLWYGHRHVRLVSQLEQLALTPSGLKPRSQWLLRTGAYLRPYGTQAPAAVLSRGRRGNYAADALLQPAGRGGLRLVLKRDGSSRVEVGSG